MSEKGWQCIWTLRCGPQDGEFRQRDFSIDLNQWLTRFLSCCDNKPFYTLISSLCLVIFKRNFELWLKHSQIFPPQSLHTCVFLCLTVKLQRWVRSRKISVPRTCYLGGDPVSGNIWTHLKILYTTKVHLSDMCARVCVCVSLRNLPGFVQSLCTEGIFVHGKSLEGSRSDLCTMTPGQEQWALAEDVSSSQILQSSSTDPASVLLLSPRWKRHISSYQLIRSHRYGYIFTIISG